MTARQSLDGRVALVTGAFRGVADPDVLRRSGRTRVVAGLARQYGFTAVDGSQPRPLTIETA